MRDGLDIIIESPYRKESEMKKYPERKFVEIDLFRQVAKECCEYQRRYETIQNLTDSLSIKLMNVCSSRHLNVRDVDMIIQICNAFTERLTTFYQSCKDWDKDNRKD